MTTVFYARPYGRFIEIKSNLKRKKLHRTKQSSNFLGGSFINGENVSPNSIPKIERDNPIILKGDFSSRINPFIFTSIAPMLLNRSNETS